jgi:cytochrome c553
MAAQSAGPPERSEFITRCAACHGGDANGGERAPAIRRDRTDAQLAEIIRRGRATGLRSMDVLMATATARWLR